MSRRPYLSKSLVELVDLVESQESSPQIISAVIHELQHRKSAGAKKWLKELQQAKPGSVGKKKKPTGKPETRRRQGKLVEGSNADVFIPSESKDFGPDARDLVSRMKALRETFTEEAEVLARWGMTPALPDALVESIFKSWREQLRDLPDDLGRSKATLESDVSLWRKRERGILDEVDDA